MVATDVAAARDQRRPHPGEFVAEPQSGCERCRSRRLDEVVGGVGLGYDHEDETRFDPWASSSVVTTDGGRFSVEFRRTPFDVDAAVDAYRVSEIPFGEESTRSWLAS